MTRHPQPPDGLTAADLDDYRQACADHEDLLAQSADREAQIENGLLDTCDNYRFTWHRATDRTPVPTAAQPPPQKATGRTREASRPDLPRHIDGEDRPPF